jgi:hypothetical protein
LARWRFLGWYVCFIGSWYLLSVRPRDPVCRALEARKRASARRRGRVRRPSDDRSAWKRVSNEPAAGRGPGHRTGCRAGHRARERADGSDLGRAGAPRLPDDGSDDPTQLYSQGVSTESRRNALRRAARRCYPSGPSTPGRSRVAPLRDPAEAPQAPASAGLAPPVPAR